MGKPRRLLTGAVGGLLVLLLIAGGRLALADDDIIGDNGGDNAVIMLNGQPLELGPKPLLVGDELYAPVCALAEAVAAPIYWEPVSQWLWLLHGGEVAAIDLTAAEVFVEADVVYLPCAQLAELLGLELAWDEASGTVCLGSEPEEETEPIVIDLDRAAAAGLEDVWLQTGGTYQISGSLAGVLRIQTCEPVCLQLLGCEISTSAGPAVYADGGGLVQIETIGDNLSILRSDGQTAVQVAGGLEIDGTGSLAIEAANGCGISADSYVHLAGGEVSITAATDGVRAGELLLADAGSLSIRAGGTGLSTGQQMFINDGELTVTEAQCGLCSEHMVTVNGGNLNLTAVGVGICAGAPDAYSNDAYYNKVEENADEAVTAVLVSLDNQAGPKDKRSIASIASGELSREQHIAINGGSVIVNAGAAALLSQGSIGQQGGVAVLYAGQGRALATAGVVLYDGGTLLAAEGRSSLGVSKLHPASGGSWLDIGLNELLPAASEITVTDQAGQNLWSYQAVGEVAHLLFADELLAPEQLYQVLINGEAYTKIGAE